MKVSIAFLAWVSAPSVFVHSFTTTKTSRVANGVVRGNLHSALASTSNNVVLAVENQKSQHGATEVLTPDQWMKDLAKQGQDFEAAVAKATNLETMPFQKENDYLARKTYFASRIAEARERAKMKETKPRSEDKPKANKEYFAQRIAEARQRAQSNSGTTMTVVDESFVVRPEVPSKSDMTVPTGHFAHRIFASRQRAFFGWKKYPSTTLESLAVREVKP